MEIEIKRRYNRKRRNYRICLGVKEFIRKPALNMLWIPIIALVIGIFLGKDAVIAYLVHDMDNPEILHFILNLLIIFFILLLFPLIIFAIFEKAGELSARWSEACLVAAFSANDLRHGHPILIDKYRIKGTGVTVREFYSPIQYKTWLDKRDAIADAMNIHFVGEEIQYGGKNNANGNRIIIKTAKGRKKAEQGVLYDEEL